MISFLSIQLLKQVLWPFHLISCLSPSLLNSFFVKRSSNFFAIKINNKICPQHSFFSFSNHKIFFRLIWSATFCKNVFIFRYSYMTTNFKFRIFLIIFVIKDNIRARLYISRLHIDCAMICIVVFIDYVS